MKKGRERHIEKVYFRVDFEGLTNLIRNFWAEGEYSKALSIMTESGIDLENAHDVIRGKLKLIQQPGGREGVEGNLAKDNWKPNLDLCMWNKYPDPKDSAFFRMIERYGVKGLNRQRSQIESALRALNESTYVPDKERLIDHLRELAIDDEVYKFFEYPTFWKLEKDWRPKRLTWAGRDKETYPDYVDELLSNDIVPMTWSGSYSPAMKELDIDAYVKRQLELEKITEKPEPCNPPERAGWLSPKGEMYACNYNEHVWLADLLGYTGVQIEKEGWVKLHYTLLKPDRLLVDKGNKDKRLTQKQIDALWEWAIHNKVDPGYIQDILEDEDDL